MCSASVYVVEDREIFRHVIIILDIKNCAALENFDIFIPFFSSVCFIPAAESFHDCEFSQADFKFHT